MEMHSVYSLVQTNVYEFVKASHLSSYSHFNFGNCFESCNNNFHLGSTFYKC
jgi:hypothetical protein